MIQLGVQIECVFEFQKKKKNVKTPPTPPPDSIVRLRPATAVRFDCEFILTNPHAFGFSIIVIAV